MGIYCFVISLVMLQVSRRVRARATQPLAA